MGGGQSKNLKQNQIEVQEIRKSSISRSPPKNKSPMQNKSPAKPEKSPPSRKKIQTATSDLFGNKTSESTVIENARTSQEAGDLSETKSKKKIKSVRKLPQGLERDNRQIKESIDEAEELRNSSGKYDKKSKTQKQNLQKLIRIYDLA